MLVLLDRESKWNHNQVWQSTVLLGTEHLVAYFLQVLNQHKKF